MAQDQARHIIVGWALALGLKWHENDLIDMPFLGAGEGHYADACQKGNTSFCNAYEKLRGRKPYLFAWETKTRQRLFVGAKFWWCGVEPTVTSFRDGDAPYMNAVLYEKGSYDYQRGAKKPQAGMGLWLCDAHREITEVRDDWTLVVNPTPAEEIRGPEKIQRRFKITLDEMREVERVSKDELGKCLELLKEKDGLKKINETIQARRLLMTPFDWEQLVRAPK